MSATISKDRIKSQLQNTMKSGAIVPIYVPDGAYVDSKAPASDRPVKEATVLSLDGVDGFVNIPDNTALNIPDKLSVFAVASTDDSDIIATQVIVGKYDQGIQEREWALVITSEEKIAVNFGNPVDGSFIGRWVSDAVIDTDTIATYGFTFDGGVVVLYVNGQEVAGSAFLSVPTALNLASAPLSIGSAFSSGVVASTFNGIISQARIYDTTILTPAEMLAIHNGTDTTVGATLKAQYNLNHKKGITIATDSSVNGNDGTLIGGASFELSNQITNNS